MNKLLLLFVLIFTLSCASDPEKELYGIWIGDRLNPLRSVTPEENTSLQQGSSILVDFKRNNSLVLKIFGHRTLNLNWEITQDSILYVDTNEYKIVSITQDTITINVKDGVEEFNYDLHRVKDSQIDIDSNKIVNVLCSKIWSYKNIDPSNISSLKFGDYIEFFDNHGKLVKYIMPNPEGTKDSVFNLQFERWAIGEYKNYYFFSRSYTQVVGFTPYCHLGQVIDISDSSCNLYEPYWIGDQICKLYGFESKMNLKEEKSKLIGLWKSQNSDENFYGRRLPERRIKSGLVKKYVGDFYYKFDEEKFTRYGVDTDTLVWKWFLNKDASVLIYQDEYDIGHSGGITIEMFEIKTLTDKNLVVRNIDNWIGGASGRPLQYILNIDQDFKKIE